MAKQPDEGKFVLFKNIKQKDTHPDYRGQINDKGEIKEIVIWVMRDKNGEQFLSGSINPLPEELESGEIGEIDGNKY